ncbi:MAG TPA: formyltransferase family protein [Planctomycetota bacterium]|nr:formyltransferase family protein [Planctomycetota bacterium]
MRAILASMNEIGAAALPALVEHLEVVGLFTPRERGKLYMDVHDFTALAARLKVPVFRIDDINSKETEAQIRSLRPDVGFSLGWKQIIKERIFTIPPAGWIGGHPARLLMPGESPDPAVLSAAGNEPMNYAILGGYRRTGMTLMWVKSKIDAGEIFARGDVDIDVEHETVRELLGKIARKTAELLRENLPALVAGRPPRTPQQLEENQPYMKPIRADDNRIDPAAPAEQTYRLIRSCIYPYPNAFIDFHGTRIYVERARLDNGVFTELKVRVGGSPYATGNVG